MSNPDDTAPQSILERVRDGVVGLDHEFRFTYVNESALRMLKKQSEGILGRCIWDVLPDAVGQSFHQAALRALETQDVSFSEGYYPPLAAWFESRFYPSPNGLTLLFHDISQRKHAEALLQGQSHVLEQIAHGVPLSTSLDSLLRMIEAHSDGMRCSILLLGLDGLHLNHGAAPSLPEEYTRAIDGVAIGPAVGSCGAAAYARAAVISPDIASDPNWEGFSELALSAGLRACWSTPIFGDAHELLGTFAMYYGAATHPNARDRKLVEMATHIAAIAIGRERAERIRRENRELDARNRAMLEASRLKSQFLANMSHEFRTPLNAILGFSEYMIDCHAGPLTDKQRECLSHVLLSGRHLLRLVNDVLEFAKSEAGKLELHLDEFELEGALREVCSIASGLARVKGIALDLRCDPALGRVTLDPQKFKQVLFNLVANAVKFTEPGGAIAVHARGLDGERFELRVRDSGIGIRREDLQKLFVEFQQLDGDINRRHEGSGLGLALAKRMVECQGGSISVESEPGVGSTFTVVLPRALASARSEAPRDGGQLSR
jgi:signal transduction histidine kinase